MDQQAKSQRKLISLSDTLYIDHRKKFSRYSSVGNFGSYRAGGGHGGGNDSYGNYGSSSSGGGYNSKTHYQSSYQRLDEPSYRSDNNYQRSDSSRYEEVKNDYHQGMKLRDERPAAQNNFDYKNYFTEDSKKEGGYSGRGRSPGPRDDNYFSMGKSGATDTSGSKKKWG